MIGMNLQSFFVADGLLQLFAAIPSLRARDCPTKEKDALNYLFLAIPLINVTLPLIWKSFPAVWSADVLAFFAMYAWKVHIQPDHAKYWSQVSEELDLTCWKCHLKCIKSIVLADSLGLQAYIMCSREIFMRKSCVPEKFWKSIFVSISCIIGHGNFD
jgi:hypothetical protein